MHSLPPPLRQDGIYGRKKFNPGGNAAVKDVIKIAAALTSYLRGSQLAMTNLATLCEELKTKLRRPQTAVDTRWDSEYRMLCIIFWLRAALQAAWGDQQKYGSSLPHKSKTGRSIYVLNPERWSLLEQLVLVLGRLERVTRAVEGSNYVTLPYVYLHLYELYHWLGKEELFDERSSIWDFNAEGGNRGWGSHEVHEAITSLRRQLRAGMQDRFLFLKHKGIPITSWPAKDQAEVKPLVIAMALHPEGPPDMSDLDHPDLIMSTSLEEQAAKDRCRKVLEDHARTLVLDAACDLYRDRHGRPLKSAGALVPPTGSRGLPAAATAAAALGGGQATPVGGTTFVHSALAGTSNARSWKQAYVVHGGAASEGPVPVAGGVGGGGEAMYDDVRRAAKSEYELFCGAKAKEHHNWSRDVSVADGDELKAFKACYGRFEHLSRVYRAYIAIPASSAGAESLFSKAGGVACVTRASLAAPQIAMQVALQDNFHDSLLDVTGYSTERKKGKEEEGRGGKEGEGGRARMDEVGNGRVMWQFTPVGPSSARKQMVFTEERGEVEAQDIMAMGDGPNAVVDGLENFHFDDEGGRWTMEWFEDEEQDTWMI